MRRWLGLGAAALVALPLLAAAGLYLFADRLELAGPVATRVTAALGRTLTIGSLRVAPHGAWLRVTLQDAVLANATNGSDPVMARLGLLRAELYLPSLLRGAPPTLRGVEADGFSLLLEHGTGPGKDAPNWRFGPPAGPPTAADIAAQRAALPLLLDAAVTDAEVLLRTSSGQALRIRAETTKLGTAGADSPGWLQVSGSYQETPVQLASTFGPASLLRSAAPFPVEITVASGETRLGFKGTMTDPLNADGAAGRLSLSAPGLSTLLTLAGADAKLDAAVELAGQMTRQGDLWRLSDASGRLAGSPLQAPLLQLVEGAAGRPDQVTVRLSVQQLDLNRLLGDAERGRGAEDPVADLPLDLDPHQDPLLQAEIAVGSLDYARMHATGVQAAIRLAAGEAAVERLALSVGGANVTASLSAAAATGGGARIEGKVALTDSDLEAMRRAIGLRPLPVSGRVDGRVAVAGEGRTLNAAAQGARVSAVIGLRHGSIAREIVEMASTDLRLLFRTPRGTVPMSCLIALLDMRGGVGEVAPLRIRAATGTITGLASFDLNRSRLDAVVGSQRDTTHFFALDVPVRISGSFADPSILPASWSADGRARLAAADHVALLPPDLRAFAQANPCYRGSGAAVAPVRANRRR